MNIWTVYFVLFIHLHAQVTSVSSFTWMGGRTDYKPDSGQPLERFSPFTWSDRTNNTLYLFGGAKDRPEQSAHLGNIKLSQTPFRTGHLSNLHHHVIKTLPITHHFKIQGVEVLESLGSIQRSIVMVIRWISANWTH